MTDIVETIDAGRIAGDARKAEQERAGAILAIGKQFNLAQYFTNCKPAADPFPGWPPPDPARLPG